jgi:hypothetical protein
VDNIEKDVILALGAGPKTVVWLAAELGRPEGQMKQALLYATLDGFVEDRGIEYLYPQTDRRDGVRRKRGKRLKTWTETRKYYALTHVGRVLLPLDSLRLGVVV